MITKIFGCVLLTAGLLIIFWALYSSYNIFTAKSAIPSVFKIETAQETSLPQTNNPSDIQAMIENTINNQMKGLLPADILPKILNLVAWSIFAGILIFGGAQISSIGIKLIKEK